MGFCSCEPEQPERMTGVKHYKDRSCTDTPMLLLYLCFWIATAVIAQQAVDNGGNPDRIIYAVDHQGRICGQGAVQNQKYGAWPDYNYFDFMVCLDNCNQTQNSDNIIEKHTSTEFLFYCIPSFSGGVEIKFTGDFESASESFSRSVGDLLTARWILLLSCLFALILAFGWLGCLQPCAGCLVWGIIATVLLAGGLTSYALLKKASDVDDENIDEDRRDGLQALGYVALVLTIVTTIVVISLRNRIKLAVEVVKVAANSLRDMKSIVCFPVWPLAVAVGYFVFWVVMAAYIYSVSNKTTVATPTTALSTRFGSTYVVYERDESFNNSLAFHFFGLLWTVQVLIYFCFMVVAGAVADWYFSPKGDDGRAIQKASRGTKVHPAAADDNRSAAWSAPGQGKGGEPLSATPVYDSCKRTFVCHFGTVAFGAFIIAVINFVRAVVKYIEAHSKEQNNRLQKCIFCCIQCALKCLHCCADKISKNAFVWTAIYGHAFLPAACSSFQLIWNNLLRVAAVNLVGQYLMVLGKLVVAALTTGICAAIFINVEPYKSDLSSPVLPCLCVFIIAYCVGSLFMIVLETAIDTVFLCFLVDCEVNKGKGLMAPEGLQRVVGKYAKESEEAAKAAYDARGDAEPA